MPPATETVVQQQAAVAELGLFALQENDLQAILNETVRRVAQTLGVEYCKVLELLPNEDSLLLRAGVGWKEGYVGEAHVGTERDSQAGYTLVSDTPVIVEDLRVETRFSGPPLLTDHDVISGVSVVIKSTKAPYGVMGAHTRNKRTFTETDAHFLQSVANLIGEAIERQRAREELEERVAERTADLRKKTRDLRTKNDLIRLMQQITRAANEAEHFEEALQVTIDAVREHTGWPVGHVYLRSNQGTSALQSTTLWSSTNNEQFTELCKITENTSFAAGEGLPGRVLERGEAAWIQDVTTDRNFPRAALAADLGVRGAFGFPVRLGEEVVAVLEFFSTEIEALDEDLLKAMEAIGTQLGRVAERERSARQLEASEKRYRSLMETAADGIVMANGDGVIIDWNPGAQAIFGYKAEEVIGKPLEILRPERYKEPHREGIARLHDTGEGPLLGRTVELEGLRKSGEEFPLELSLSSWTIGEERYFASIIRDITERREAEEALRQSEEKFRVLAEESQVGIVLIGEQGFRYVNPGFTEFLGYHREELIGSSPKKIVHPSDWPRVEESIRQRLSGTKEAVRSSFRAQDKAGQTLYFDAYGARIAYQGQPTILGTVFDVTDKRRLEQEILQIQEQERRRIGQDLHDRIGANLSGIAMMLRSITTELKEKHADKVDALDDILEQIRETTTDVRRLSRGLNPVHLDKEGLSAALQRLASHTVNRANIACVYEEEPSLPRLPDKLTSHLYWIAQEATTNAVRHGDPDHIWIRLQRDGNQLVLTIEDDGKGFDPSSVEEGMGQHTMRYRAELVGGQVDTQTRTGGGTKVRFILPLPPEAQTADSSQ